MNIAHDGPIIGNIIDPYWARSCNNKTMTNATEAEIDKWGSANAHQTQLKIATVTIVKLAAMMTQLAASVKKVHYDTLAWLV
jgi:hypothetical protein